MNETGWECDRNSTLCTEHGTTLDTFGATPSCVQTLTRIRSAGAPLPHMGLIHYINQETANTVDGYNIFDVFPKSQQQKISNNKIIPYIDCYIKATKGKLDVLIGVCETDSL